MTTFIGNLKRSSMEKFTDALVVSPPDETLIYINIGGSNPFDLQEALDSLFVDSSSRDFELVDIKKQNTLIGVLLCMKPKTPVKF